MVKRHVGCFGTGLGGGENPVPSLNKKNEELEIQRATDLSPRNCSVRDLARSIVK
jgi:hypothetical protein